MVSVSRAVVAPSGFLVCVAESGELIPKSSEAAERLPNLLYHSTPKAGGAETGPPAGWRKRTKRVARSQNRGAEGLDLPLDNSRYNEYYALADLRRPP